MVEEGNSRKDPTERSYRFIDHNFKIGYVLRRIEGLEAEHFGLIVDRLDDKHPDYEEWLDAVDSVIKEIERLEFIYKQLGGTFGSEIPGMGR